MTAGNIRISTSPYEMRKLTKRPNHEQRKFMRKIRHRKEDAAAKKCKRSNMDKQRLKVQRAYV